MTFKELQDDALERLDFDPTVTTATQGTPRYRIKAFINEWNRRILSRPGMTRLRDAETTLAVLAGTNTYTLVPSISRLRGMTDQTTGIPFQERSLDWLRQVDPMESSTGTPSAYILRGLTQIVLWPKPAQAGTLAIDYVSTLFALATDGDVPLLPEDFQYLLSTGARVNEYERMDDDRKQGAVAELEAGIRDLRYFLVNTSSHTRMPGQSFGGFSRLGPHFPAGS